MNGAVGCWLADRANSGQWSCDGSWASSFPSQSLHHRMEKMAIQKVCMSSFVEMNHCSGFPLECTKHVTTTASTAPQVKPYSLQHPAQAKDNACRDGRLYSVNTSVFSMTIFPQIVTMAFIYPNCRGPHVLIGGMLSLY